MRLSFKLNFGLLVVVSAVIGFQLQQRVRRELELFETEMRRDHHVMGRVLRHAVEDEWADGGEVAAHALVERVNQREEGVLIRWVDVAAEPAAGREPASPPVAFQALAAGESEHLDRQGSPGRLYSYLPLRVPSAQPAAIEIGEVLTNQESYTTLTLRRAVLWLLVLSAATWGSVALLMHWMVGRPVQRLIAHARRVGTGDFSSRVGALSGDELGELGGELDTMAGALADARDRVAAEQAARAAALEQLRHADRLMTVGRLAAGLAHELGTPLNVALARAKMVAAWEVDSVDDAREGARIISEQCDRMTGILRQLLDFARPRTPDRSPADLRAVVERTVALVAPMARKREVALVVEASRPVVAPIDVAQMQQVVSNLVVNALDATPPGGRVTLSLGLHEGSVRVTVRDTGTGIAPDHIAHVFEPFFTTKDVGVGTGLGLSVSHGIVRDHGGRISVESAVGDGTAFHVILPAGGPA